ncbi:MAG: hypothetical protein WC473_01885 [Patescibacteria group bacterium]|jgi:hypothetical protein
MSTLYSVGQANKVMDAFEAAGYTPEEMTKLQQFKSLAEFKKVLHGLAEIIVTKYIIDCDVHPFVPSGWKVEEHQKGGQLEWNPALIELYLANDQKNNIVKGHALRKLLAGKLVLNANVLDYLLAHLELIPEEWKGKCIFFWGTIYRDSDDRLFVRYLCWGGGGWDWGYGWLDGGFGVGDPAALRK